MKKIGRLELRRGPRQHPANGWLDLHGRFFRTRFQWRREPIRNPSYELFEMQKRNLRSLDDDERKVRIELANTTVRAALRAWEEHCGIPTAVTRDRDLVDWIAGLVNRIGDEVGANFQHVEKRVTIDTEALAG